MDNKQLINMAIEAKKKAYAPYSKFSVGSAILCESGKVFTGCNVENACTPAGICAERTAIVKAVSEGEGGFTKIAIVSDSDTYCTPCGICRQSISEFGSDIEIICAKNDGTYITYTTNELLPHAFTKDVTGDK